VKDNMNIDDHSYLWLQEKDKYVLVKGKHGYSVINKVDHTMLLIEDDELADAIAAEMIKQGNAVYDSILEAYADVD